MLTLFPHVLEIPNYALYNTQSKPNWLFNTQSRVLLQADRLILKNNEEATLNISMPYSNV